MKRLFIVSLVSVIATSVFALKRNQAYRDARKFGALAKIQIHIVDDLGSEVPAAEVRVFMGMNFRPNGYYLNGVTDTNGIYIVEGKTCGDEIIIDVTKQGYYASTKKLSFAEMGDEHDVQDGRWQPFGGEERIPLRRTIHPENLIVFEKIIDVPQTNAWLGFDMEKMDFINPFGVGVFSDFELKADWDGLPAWKSKHCGAEIRFSGTKTGGYYVDNVIESRFPYAYTARIDSSFKEKSIRIVERNGDSHSTKVPFAKDVSLVTRTRSIVDEQGKLKMTNYGCIKRFEIGPSRRGVALLRLSYIFNPTPNDTNLEPK